MRWSGYLIRMPPGCQFGKGVFDIILGGSPIQDPGQAGAITSLGCLSASVSPQRSWRRWLWTASSGRLPETAAPRLAAEYGWINFFIRKFYSVLISII